MINRGRGDIRRLAAASATSGTGDWAVSTALALAVYAKTGSAGWLSVSFPLIHHFGVGGVGYGIINVVWGAGGLVDIACAVALAVSLRWTPRRPAEPGPLPRTTGP